MQVNFGLQDVFAGFKRLANNQVVLGELKQMLADNIEREQNIMSQITDWAAKEQADLDAISGALDGIVAGVAALDKLISDFQNSPGTLSPSDQAALDAIQTASTAVVAKTKAIVVTPPVPPAPVA